MRKIQALTLLAACSLPAGVVHASPSWWDLADLFLAKKTDNEAMSQQPALWRIEHEGAEVYLMGTLHQLRVEGSWFNGAVKDAFRRSDVLITETDRSDASFERRKFGLSARYVTTTPMVDRLTAAYDPAYMEVMADLPAHFKDLQYIDPFFMGAAIGQVARKRAGYTGSKGADQTLEREAKAAGKEIFGLETAEESWERMIGLPEAAKMMFLAYRIDNYWSVETEMDALIEPWSRGDLTAYQTASQQQSSSFDELTKKEFSEGNILWAKRIQDYLIRSRKPTLIAVGIGHFIGDHNLLEELGRLGTKVRRVEPSREKAP